MRAAASSARRHTSFELRAGAAPATTRIAPQPLGACACAMGSSPQDRGADGSAAAIPAPSPPRALDVDRDALEAAVRDMLRALGEDVHREGLADTPKRVAKAMAFAVRGYGMSATHHVESALFHEPGLKSDEEALAEALADDAPPASRAATPAPLAADPSALARPGTVLVRDIPFFSTDEDTLLPFYGRCHVGYVPREGVIVGLSKVARVAEVFARRAQTPDRLAADVADALSRGASPRGVRVLLEAAQMGPHGPAPVRGEADVGCFQSTHPEGAQYRAEFAAMLADEVGAGIGPGVGLGGGSRARALAGGAGASAGVAARGVSRPSPEAQYPSPNVADDVEVGSVTTTTRLPIGDGEGVGDRVGAGGGSTDPAGSDGGSDASDDAAMAMDDAKVSPDVSEENADGPVEGAKGVNGRAARLDDSGSRPATPALLGECGGAAAAPPAAAEAVERMMRALGLDARMSADRLAATARRYADLMAASREGHAMAASDAAAAGRGGPGADAPAAGEKRKRRAADRPDDATDDAIDGSFEMVVERDLELATLCEHHLLPFHGAVHVAYLRPASGASGLGSGPGSGSGSGSGSGPTSGSGLTRAALQRIVTTHGRRLQVQERLTRDIARDVRAASGARGVMVAVRASHLCMIARGVEKPGSTTCTSACLGAFAGSCDRRGAFWSALAGDAEGGEEGRR